MTERIECRCGGILRKDGNQFICENCDSVYLISADDKGELFAYQPIEKKHIQTGQIATKATAIDVKEVVVRQIQLDEDIENQVAQESMDLDKHSRIGLIEGYLTTGDWEKVDEHVNNLLLENKDCSEAKWFGWMSEKKASDYHKMLSKLKDFSKNDSVRLDQILAYASPAFAKRIITLFFDGAFANDNMCYFALSTILPYARNEVIYGEKEFAGKVRVAFDRVIQNTYEKAFNYLLENTLRSDEVDTYIQYVSRFADGCDAKTSLAYYEKVLAVDPGNLEIHRKLICADIDCNTPCQKTISDVERLISYSDNTDTEIQSFIKQLCDERHTTVNKSDVMWQLLGYHSAAPEGLKTQILKYGQLLLESKLWLRARDFFNLVLSFDVRCGEAYWGLCLVQMEAKNAQDAVGKKEPIKSFSAYDKALAVFSAVGDTQKVAYLRELSEKQKNNKKIKKIVLISIAAVLSFILFVIFAARVSHNRKYSPNNIKMTLVNVDSIQEPLTEFDIEIDNGCRKDVSRLQITLRFYDSENTLLYTTSVDMSGYMESRDECVMTIKLHRDVSEALYWYSFDELRITVAINYVGFNNYRYKDLGDGKERILKKSQKPDKSEIEAIGKKLTEAFAHLDGVKETDSNFEEKIMEFATALDAIWNDVYRNRTHLNTMYEKAEQYQENEEYEKAYYVFSLLANIEYKDSADRAYECAMYVPY